MRFVPACVALGAFVLLTNRGSAQTAPTPPATPLGWATAAELGLNAARGNSSYTTMSTSVRFSHVDKRQFEFEMSGALTYGESDDEVIARRMVGAIKGDFHPQATWSPFLFASAERDEIRRVDLLMNSGAGVKWTFFRNVPGAASISLAAVHSYKDISDADATIPPAGPEPAKSTIRLSLRPKIVQRLPSGFTFEQTSFWQPVVNHTEDYSIEAATRVGYVVAKTQSIFVQHTYRYDSRPPSGVKREDQLMLAGLKVQF